VPVLEVKIASPLYSAVMVCVPTDKDDQIKGALPLDKTTALPMLIPSTLNCTDPVGVPDPGGTALTVAVNVTACPETDGFTDEVTSVWDEYGTVCRLGLCPGPAQVVGAAASIQITTILNVAMTTPTSRSRSQM
jgi:hypothetical protein